MRRESPDDFRKRMVANLAALVLLTTFATLSAVDVYNIARMEGCAQASECGLSGYYLIGCSKCDHPRRW